MPPAHPRCESMPPFAPCLHVGDSPFQVLHGLCPHFSPNTHLTEEETGPRRGEVTCPRGHSCEITQWGLFHSIALILRVIKILILLVILGFGGGWELRVRRP